MGVRFPPPVPIPSIGNWLWPERRRLGPSPKVHGDDTQIDSGPPRFDSSDGTFHNLTWVSSGYEIQARKSRGRSGLTSRERGFDSYYVYDGAKFDKKRRVITRFLTDANNSPHHATDAEWTAAGVLSLINEGSTPSGGAGVSECHSPVRSPLAAVVPQSSEPTKVGIGPRDTSSALHPTG